MTVHVDHPDAFIDALARDIAESPGLLNALERIMPVTVACDFQSHDKFENLAQKAVQPWLDVLEDKSFHVRMHRRGFKGRLSSLHEEQFLDHFIVEQTKTEGHPARISFYDPDIIDGW